MSTFSEHSLSKEDVNRFSRQLILKSFGVKGQEALQSVRVLIVGAGGLGCPVAAYLAAAGVGFLGIVDHDRVSRDNLHRQILHADSSVGSLKVDSVKAALLRLNPNVVVDTYPHLFDSSTALEIIEKYDVVTDCSDNVATRYLINDACIMSKRPLVSGSALGWEGQLTVYGCGEACPCYRCIFPRPPPPETVTSCSEGGVLGPITGVIGSLQALETIKIAINGKSSYAGQLFLFDGFGGRTRVIKLRARNPSCELCGDLPIIRTLIDYTQFCGAAPTDKVRERDLLTKEQRISPRDYQMRRHDADARPLLIDVRPSSEFEICHLPEALNCPLKDITSSIVSGLLAKATQHDTVFVICHRGNDSQLAVDALQRQFGDSDICFRDIAGGLDAWARQVDDRFPQY